MPVIAESLRAAGPSMEQSKIVGEAPVISEGLQDASSLKKATKAEKVNPNKVVKNEPRYIQTKRLKVDKLHKYFEGKLAQTTDAPFSITKKRLKHLFGIDKTQKTRASGAVDAKYSGFHHDKGEKLMQKGKIEFLSEPQICPKTGVIIVEKYAVEGIVYEKTKTFFPSGWSRHKVIDTIIEASENIKSQEMEGSTRILVGISTDGVQIKMAVSPENELISAYPVSKV